uniref:Methyltransferase type 11 domain-containing protein n=1 Tax=mine drainage metagenome TaxID=410659 RepID=E6Q525_9ZZZZ
MGDVSSRLPFDDACFDVAIFGEVIEHLVDPDAALQEISRVLRPGGYLVLTTPNLACWFNRIVLVIGVQPIFTETSLHAKIGRKWSFLGQLVTTPRF